MATIQTNEDQSLSLVLADIEREIFDRLPVDQLSEFITIWLAEKSAILFKDRFASLTVEQKGQVLTMMKELSDKG